MSDIGAVYAATLPQTALQFYSSEPTTTTSSEKDISQLDPGPTNIFNLRFDFFAKAIRQAIDNSQLAVAMLQLIKDSYERIDEILDEMKDLADSAADADVSDWQRTLLNGQFVALRESIEVIVDNTVFRGSKVINEDKTLSFKVGTGDQSSDDIVVNLLSMMPADLAAGLDSADISTLAGAQSAQTVLTTAQNNTASRTGSVSAAVTRLRYAAKSLIGQEGANLDMVDTKFPAVQVSDDILIKIKWNRTAEKLFLVSFLGANKPLVDLTV